MSEPLVTVAIPLYRSLRFIDIIVENIRNLDYPNLEILVGDRHLDDDAIERLRAEFAGDDRLRFITANDEISWVEHYNLLLREGKGEYFLWMPHDDSYSPGYIADLVERLEAAPGSLLAFGWCDAIDADQTRAGSMVAGHWPAPPLKPGEDWGPRVALRLLFAWTIGVAMRGVFRRAPVVEASHWLPQTAGSEHADTCWLFGMALLGRFEFVPDVRCLKRMYATSTHANWRSPKLGELPRLMSGYLDAYVPSRGGRLGARVMLWLGAAANRAVQLVNAATRRTLISDDGLRGAFRWVLGG
ncbi:MAG: glycosyltransferase family A protein [Dehalococcoidia bacterium]